MSGLINTCLLWRSPAPQSASCVQPLVLCLNPCSCYQVTGNIRNSAAVDSKRYPLALDTIIQHPYVMLLC